VLSFKIWVREVKNFLKGLGFFSLTVSLGDVDHSLNSDNDTSICTLRGGEEDRNNGHSMISLKT